MPRSTDIPRVAKQGVSAAPPRHPQPTKALAKVVAKGSAATSAPASRIAQPPATRVNRQVAVIPAPATRKAVSAAASRPAVASPSSRGAPKDCKRTMSARSTTAWAAVSASFKGREALTAPTRTASATTTKAASAAPRTAVRTASTSAASTSARPAPRTAAPRTLPSVVAAHAKQKPAASDPPQPLEAATAASAAARATLPSSSATLAAPARPTTTVSPLRVLAVSPFVRAPSSTSKCRRQSLNGTVYHLGHVSWSEHDETVLTDADCTASDTLQDESIAMVDPKGRNVDDFVRTGRWPVTPPAVFSKPLPDPTEDALEYSKALKQRQVAVLENRVRVLDGVADRYRACIEYAYQGTIAGKRITREPTWLKDLVKDNSSPPCKDNSSPCAKKVLRLQR